MYLNRYNLFSFEVITMCWIITLDVFKFKLTCLTMMGLAGWIITLDVFK